MSADFNKPAVTDTKVSVLSVIRDMFASLVKMDGAGANLPVDALRYSSSSDRIEKWNGSSWVAVLNAQTPVGTIAPTVLAAAPTGWALCQGQTVSKTGAYAGLWAAMGSAHLFGADPGGGNFILPDMRTRMPVGKSSEVETLTIGQYGGEKAVTLTTDALPAVGLTIPTMTTGNESLNHTHDYEKWSVTGTPTAAEQNQAGAPTDYATTTSTASSGVSVNHTHQISGYSTGNMGAGGSHNNLPPYLVLNYIVKL